MIIEGASLTIPWLVRDFPGINIAYLRRTSDSIRITGRNKHISLSNVLEFILDEESHTITHNGKECEFLKVTDDGSVMSLFYIDKYGKKQHFIGYFFLGMGCDPNINVTRLLSPDKCLNLPFSRPKDWVAPNNIPVGSLMESFLLWMIETQNIHHSHEVQAYYADVFEELFDDHFTTRKEFFNTVKEHSFFNRINDEIKKLDTPLPEEDFDKKFKQVFHDVLSTGLNDHLEKYTYRPKIK